MRTEEMIRQRLTSLEEGMAEATQSYLIEDLPMYVIFYNKKNKGCIGVNVFGLSDPSYKKEEQRLAEALNISSNYLSQVERGCKSLSLDKLLELELATVLEIDRK